MNYNAITSFFNASLTSSVGSPTSGNRCSQITPSKSIIKEGVFLSIVSYGELIVYTSVIFLFTMCTIVV